MGPIQPPLVERRRFFRSEVLATAVVFSPDRLHGTYLVTDLSAGGACLIGGSSLSVGAQIRVMIQLPGKPLGSLAARVIRRGPTQTAGEHFGVAFVELRAEDEDAIHQALVGELERMRARREATVMMMYHEGNTRDCLERDLRKLGHASIAVSTPLEAIAWLQRPDLKIKTVLVDLAFGPARGVDMLHFLAEHHPEIQRVVISAEDRSFRLDLALKSGRAHAALHNPWNDDVLSGVIRPAVAEQQPAL